MLRNIFPLSLLLLTALFFSACEKDDPDVDPPLEVITTVNYTLTPDGGGAAVVLTFSDSDGDGGNAPVITGGTLEANQSYTGGLELLNESTSPTEDITEEIREEDLEHQFFFQSDLSNLTVAYNDEDADSNPVGLSSTITTGDPESGTLTITLRHEPNKSGEGVSDGDITNAGGETDIEVTFPIDVQ